MAQSYEPDGTPSRRNYVLYAYCLMSNHIHLLIREREDNIGMAIKRIASSYVYDETGTRWFHGGSRWGNRREE